MFSQQLAGHRLVPGPLEHPEPEQDQGLLVILVLQVAQERLVLVLDQLVRVAQLDLGLRLVLLDLVLD